MKRTKKLTIVSIVILFSLMTSAILPISVLADDSTPPPVQTSEVSQPTQEPVVADSSTQEPVVTEAPTEQPSITEASTGQPVVDGTPSPEATQSFDTTATTQPAAQPTEAVNLTDVVSTAAESNVTLANAEGDALVMGTVEAAHTLATGDPYFTRGNPPVVYRFVAAGGCAAFAGDGSICTESATPIQAALNNVKLNGLPNDKTVYVGPGTYAEQVVIEMPNLILKGDPGNETVAGAGANAPVMDGLSISGTKTAFTILVEGVTISGFIIQNYDTAI